MDTAEFGNLWTLMANLFPASPKLKKQNMKKVWEIAVSSYALEDVTSSMVAYARKNKFFPDIADITSGLAEISGEKKMQPKKAFDTSWMLVYIQREAAHYSAEHAEQYHAAGVQTWPEARKSNVEWRDWIADCRRAFSTGRGHTRIFPDE